MNSKIFFEFTISISNGIQYDNQGNVSTYTYNSQYTISSYAMSVYVMRELFYEAVEVLKRNYPHAAIINVKQLGGDVLY